VDQLLFRQPIHVGELLSYLIAGNDTGHFAEMGCNRVLRVVGHLPVHAARRRSMRA